MKKDSEKKIYNNYYGHNTISKSFVSETPFKMVYGLYVIITVEMNPLFKAK